MEELERKVKELERKVNYLEKRESGRKRRAIIKLLIKIAIIVIICYFLYQGYSRIKTTVKPAIDSYNNIVEKMDEINSGTEKAKDNVKKTPKQIEKFIDDLLKNYSKDKN